MAPFRSFFVIYLAPHFAKILHNSSVHLFTAVAIFVELLICKTLFVVRHAIVPVAYVAVYVGYALLGALFCIIGGPGIPAHANRSEWFAFRVEKCSSY